MFEVGKTYICSPESHNSYIFTVLKISGDSITFKWTRNDSAWIQFSDSIKQLKRYVIIEHEIYNSKLYKALE